MRRYFGRGVALRLFGLLGALLVFSSCVSMELESDFDEDGGAVHTMALTIDMSDLEQLGDIGTVDPFEDFEDIEREAAEEGYRVERIEDGDIVGVRVIQEVEDSSNLGDILNGMFNAGSAEDETVAPFSGTYEKDGDDYRIDLLVDGAQLTDSAGEGLEDGGEGGDLDELGLDMSMIFDFTYSARMPGEIDEEVTNGRVSDDGVITWTLPLEGSATLTAASSDDSGSSNLLLLLVIVGIVVLGLIALAAVAFFILMNRRGSVPAPATTEGPVTPPPPATPSSYSYTDPDQPTRPMAPVPPPPDQPEDELPPVRPDEPDEPERQDRDEPPRSY